MFGLSSRHTSAVWRAVAQPGPSPLYYIVDCGEAPQQGILDSITTEYNANKILHATVSINHPVTPLFA